MKKFFLLGLCCSLFALQTPAEGTTYTWLGSTDDFCAADPFMTYNYVKYLCPEVNQRYDPCQCSNVWGDKTINGVQYAYCDDNSENVDGHCSYQKFNPKMCDGGTAGIVTHDAGYYWSLGCYAYTHKGLGGSWKQSCIPIKIVPYLGEFTASCKKNDGKYQMTQYDLHDCWTGNLFNDNGTLECDYSTTTSSQDATPEKPKIQGREREKSISPMKREYEARPQSLQLREEEQRTREERPLEERER